MLRFRLWVEMKFPKVEDLPSSAADSVRKDVDAARQRNVRAAHLQQRAAKAQRTSGGRIASDVEDWRQEVAFLTQELPLLAKGEDAWVVMRDGDLDLDA